MKSYQEYRSESLTESNLLAAAKAGDLNKLRSLLGDGSTLNTKDQKGYSPLMYAAYYGHDEAVQYLISQGADVNSTDLGGNSILMGVAFKGHSEILERLLSAGANLHFKNQQGLTAVDFARMFGRFDLVQKLENKKNSRGQMVLQAAASWLNYTFKKLTQRSL